MRRGWFLRLFWSVSPSYPKYVKKRLLVPTGICPEKTRFWVGTPEIGLTVTAARMEAMRATSSRIFLGEYI